MIRLTSSHQTRSASCSAQPGNGRLTSCSICVCATTRPSLVTSVPLDVSVPTSTPRRYAKTAHVVAGTINVRTSKRQHFSGGGVVGHQRLHVAAADSSQDRGCFLP